MPSNVPRDFLQTSGLLNRGAYMERVNDHVARLLQMLEEMPGRTGKGEVTLTFSFDSKEGMVSLSPKVKSKLPDLPTLAATPFWLVDGQLSVQHPSQLDMFEKPRAVRTDPAPGTA